MAPNAPGPVLDPASFLRTVPPFDALSADAFRQAAEALQIAYYPKGTWILKAGSAPSTFLYVIRKGAVRLERDGRTVALEEQGDSFGYPSMISGLASFDVIVDEELLAYQLPEAVFRDLLTDASFARFFTAGLGERLRDSLTPRADERIGDLSAPVLGLLARAPVFVPASATIAEAAAKMREQAVSSVLVEGDPPGILTDRDLRNRVLAEGLAPRTLVARIASFPARTIPAETPVYGAWMVMLENKAHHLPVTRDGRIVGMVTATDLLRHQTYGPTFALKHVERLAGREALGGYAAEVARMASVLFHGGLETTRISRLVSSISDALVRRILEWAERDFGKPPCEYAFVVLGSEGRYEQTLLTDQDNALVWAEDSAEAERYFERLAERVVTDLIAAGFPRCTGGYMATAWKGSLSLWQDRFAGWIESPDAQALLKSEIFFDLRRAGGALDLAPLTDVIRTAGAHAPFLAHLAAAALTFRPPLGLFRRLKEEEGQIDLKRSGLMPIVELARAYALKARSPVTNTLERLSAAARAGLLNSDESETLSDGYRFLLHLRLKHQLQRLSKGEAPDNHLPVEALSAVDRRHLREIFLAVSEVQTGTAWLFQTAEL